MKRISRRDFLQGLTGLGVCALSGGALLSSLSCTARGEAESARIAEAAAPDSPFAREAMYYAGIEEGLDCTACHGAAQPSKITYCHVPHAGQYVRCRLCPKGCIISEGKRGDCGVRENRGGKLYTMVFGNPCSLNNDPIEKKPFYHFLPGTLAFSLATAGCNLHCQYCQNWTISQRRPEEVEAIDLPPEKLVAAALKYGSASIAYTYSEPTIFYEYMITIAQLARKVGLKNVVISAGYINPAPLRELCRTVDAIKIDLKGFNEEFYRKVCDAERDGVLRTIKIIHEEGVHLEIVNLVVPTLNDDPEEMRQLSRWVVDNVGPDVPTHFSRFYPQYKLKNLPPTPVESLERAREIAMEEGIRYAYVGNVPGHPGDNTYCHNCGKMLIKRMGFDILEYHIVDGKCEYCGQPLPGVWSKKVEREEYPGMTGPSEY
ncbi:MAG: AmmeMemoRadiSam system radical SAM enzyme [Anaerolineae bacterium]